MTVTVGAVTVTLTPGATQLPVGATTDYTASASDNGVAVVNPQISWASSVPTIASVSATGTVTGHAPGTARIVATFRGWRPAPRSRCRSSRMRRNFLAGVLAGALLLLAGCMDSPVDRRASPRGTPGWR